MDTYRIADSEYHVSVDVAQILRSTESCAGEFGEVADRFLIALISPEVEVAAKANDQCTEVLGRVLSKAISSSMTSLGGGLSLMACWWRVTRDPAQFGQLMHCVGLIAAENSSRFTPLREVK